MVRIGKLSEREQYLIGIALYWAEGTKTHNTETSLANTDPVMVKFFICWLLILGVPKEKIRVRVHLYSDMDIQAEFSFWEKYLGIPLAQFRKPYIKPSRQSDLTHYNSHRHGTCNILYGNRVLNDSVLQSMRYLRDILE